MLTLRVALLFVALLCGGIGAGTAYAFFFDFNPADDSLASWVGRLQHAIRFAGKALFVVQPLAFLATLGSLILAWNDRPTVWFFDVAAACFVLAAFVTRLGNIPINAQLKTWSVAALPPNAGALVERWWRFHVARFLALLAGSSALIFGALVRNAG
jgi:hypothetical protein